MRKTVKPCHWHTWKKLSIPLLSLALMFLALVNLPGFHTETKPVEIAVNDKYRELVHSYVKEILAKECRPSFTRLKMLAEHPQNSSRITAPFLDKNSHLNDQIFQYPPPFGFLKMKSKLEEVLKLLPAFSKETLKGLSCRRCLVIGNGGVLKGLHLGPLLNRFNTVIRLNSGPLQGFSADVGNRTTLRMSYPEGCPKVWEDPDPDLKFVAVIYKSVDFHWLRAMISRTSVALWDRLFFWKNVPMSVPLKPSQFLLLNPEIVSDAALHFLHYPKPRERFWGWDQNVPTLGLTALNLATHLCDEVSLAGFGYNLSQSKVPLHYYDSRPMTHMLKEAMHDVQTETAFLKHLVTSGSITDLTGGIHCSFC